MHSSKINGSLSLFGLNKATPCRWRPLLGVLVLVCQWWISLPAQAFICGRVNQGSGSSNIGSGASLAWSGREIVFFLNEESLGNVDPITLGSIPQVRSTLVKGAQTWSTLRRRPESIDCSQRLTSQAQGTSQTDINLRLADEPTLQRYVGYNYLIPQANQNIIVFRPNNWYPDLDKQGILGLTTTSFNPVTGLILDADIELNSQGHTFYSDNLFPNPIPSLGSHVDLLYVISHELGHAIGFNHSNDSNALMFGNAPSNNNFLSKRDLSCDDLVMVLFRYPDASPTRYCAADDINPDCGYCAPKTALAFEALIKTLRNDSGGGAFGCQQHILSDHALWLLPGMVGWWQRRRRQGGWRWGTTKEPKT